ncbi:MULTISPECIES: GNAT family N-acetyltransferase [unclassified Streptomyces]|uniref:GNAT family N-acetyltransferase n=1 Tax=unclassified Streptomyces TaxID=2593676 RepID=UPI003401FC08
MPMPMPMPAPPPILRPATAADLPALQDIERAAGEAFRPLGMAAVADDEPLSVEELERYRSAGRAWVAAGVPAHADAAPVAYLIGDLLTEPVAEPDGAGPAFHIEQVSVHPRAARHRIGRALIAHAADHARTLGATALTLTTFADVPWNAPYYARIGFRPLADAELTPALRRIRAHEAELGLDRWPRLCMRRAIPDGPLTARTAP